MPRFSLSRVVRERLANNEVISIEDLAAEAYEDPEGAVHKARSIMYAVRKKVEKETERQVVCEHGNYRLLDRKDGKKAVGDSERRTRRAISSTESAYRAYEIILKHHPEQASIVKKHAMNLLQQAVAVETKLMIKR